VLLDAAESVSHGVGMNDKLLRRDVHGDVVLPYPKRVDEDLAVLVSQIAETVQRIADGFDHDLGGAD